MMDWSDIKCIVQGSLMGGISCIVAQGLGFGLFDSLMFTALCSTFFIIERIDK